MQNALYMLSPVRLPVCVYHRKTVKVRIMKFSPYGSLIPFRGKFHPEILNPPIFLGLSVNISKTVADTAKVTIID